MKISLNVEVRKVLELIAKEPVLQRMIWALILLCYLVAIRWW